LGDSLGVAMALEALGNLAHLRGNSAHALRVIGAASGLRVRVLPELSTTAVGTRLHDTIAAAESALGAEAASACLDEGQRMGLEEAVRYARTAPEQATTTRPAPAQLPSTAGVLAPLTRREQEVAALLLRGLSNRQIAEELVITERTAETHVCRILSKLGLGSRAQLASWVMDRWSPLEKRASS
jgi:DNA-binding NarL/FixJ family response regulator